MPDADDPTKIPEGATVVAAEDSDDEDNTQAAGELDVATLADLLEITAAQAEKDGTG